MILRWFILYSLFSLIIAINAEGQRYKVYPDSTKLSNSKKAFTYVGFLTSSFLMLNNHEIGHTVFARVSGDHSSYYSLYDKNLYGGCLGCNYYNYKNLSQFGNAIVPLGGIAFSQGLSKFADATLNNFSMSHGMQRFVAGTYVVSKFDMAIQVIQGLLQDDQFYNMQKYQVPSGVDMVAFGYYASGGNKTNYDLIQVAFIAVTALDIYLSRRTIKRNWKILFNKQYHSRNR